MIFCRSHHSGLHPLLNDGDLAEPYENFQMLVSHYIILL